ncbi:MAG: ABC transporter substrate-binding protein [Clostridia bacterium]|nr:ABC transporter substrate-binding protein [Clostridia bacterium]
MKKIIALVLALTLVFAFAACSGKDSDATTASGDSSSAPNSEAVTYKIGICNYVDDASLNQIYQNIESKLASIGSEKNVKFEIAYDNCNADPNVLNQIIANFVADKVDLMVGIATPVAMAMQSATKDNKIPVVFSAVSDPVGAKLVESLDKPGSNVTGTSDYLDTSSIMNLVFAVNSNVKKVGLLYDVGQDSSTAAIAAAKKYLEEKGIEVIERTGTTVDEVVLAAQALVSDKVDAVFTPTDNTIMKAELSIYEILSKAGIPHYTGADSFALNGAFLGYGVDYANLGEQTAEMIAEVLLDGKDPAEMAVRTFDNGTATVNTETCEALGMSFDEVSEKIKPFCTAVKSIKTAESFSDAQ